MQPASLYLVDSSLLIHTVSHSCLELRLESMGVLGRTYVNWTDPVTMQRHASQYFLIMPWFFSPAASSSTEAASSKMATESWSSVSKASTACWSDLPSPMRMGTAFTTLSALAASWGYMEKLVKIRFPSRYWVSGLLTISFLRESMSLVL